MRSCEDMGWNGWLVIGFMAMLMNLRVPLQEVYRVLSNYRLVKEDCELWLQLIELQCQYRVTRIK
jgi:hypothetical protein